MYRCSHGIISCPGPLSAAGPIFERNTDGRETVADGVAGCEVFCCAGVGASPRVGPFEAPA